MKTLIKDRLTNEFYCVEMNDLDPQTGEAMAGPNDFPFWSDDVTEAFDFGGEISARNEMNMNDLTADGSRVPEVVLIFKNGYIINLL